MHSALKALVVGCSYSKGQGLDLEIQDPALWTNQLLQYISPGCNITNLSCSGKNNHWIFTEAYTAIIQQDPDIVLLGWTDQSRLNFTVGLETYCTDTVFKNHDIQINPDITVSAKQLKSVGDQLRRWYNDHWTLLDLVKYVNILYDAQVTQRKKTLICVNSLMHIPNNYFDKKEFKFPSDLSKFEQNMLNADTRDDQEIKQLYHMTHQNYQRYGGIKSHIWLNLYQSLDSMKEDTVSDTDRHPGYVSQSAYSKYLIEKYNETSYYSHT